MRMTKTVAALGIGLLMAGCDPVLSLHPLATGKDLVFEPSLIGTWVDREGKNTLTFQMTFQMLGELQAKADAYDVIYTQNGLPAKFTAYLVRLGESLFLGAFPHPKEPLIDIKNNFYAAHLIPSHTFSRVRIEGDQLHIEPLSAEWVKKMIDQKKVEIPHQRLGDRVVLIASPNDLQKLLLKATEEGKAFLEPIQWHKQRDAELCISPTPSADNHPPKQLTTTELGVLISAYGFLVKAKINRPDRIIIVIGEYHQFRDVQDDVYCLIKEMTSLYKNISFLAFEGNPYDGGKHYADGQRLRQKEMMGLPVIGLEGQSSGQRWSWELAIDRRHRELAKKIIEGGLTSDEATEYASVASLSDQVIVKRRSWEWIDNVRDFMERNSVNVGLINTGFAHFPSMEERLNHYGYSYALILPHATHNYCECEAYWTKRKPDETLSCKSVCEDPSIKPWWD